MIIFSDPPRQLHKIPHTERLGAALEKRMFRP